MIVLAHIKEQSRLNLGSYGRPRMTEELKELGLNMGHSRIGRLLRENGIRVERSKKYKVTTDSNHSFNIAPNLLNRDFRADAPNQKWAGDISYVWTQEGWLYLAVILDLHSRRVIGWAVSNRMKRDLASRFDAIVELVARDTQHLHRVVVEKFSSREEIHRIETSIIFDGARQNDLTALLNTDD